MYCCNMKPMQIIRMLKPNPGQKLWDQETKPYDWHLIFLFRYCQLQIELLINSKTN